MLLDMLVGNSQYCDISNHCIHCFDSVGWMSGRASGP